MQTSNLYQQTHELLQERSHWRAVDCMNASHERSLAVIPYQTAFIGPDLFYYLIPLTGQELALPPSAIVEVFDEILSGLTDLLGEPHIRVWDRYAYPYEEGKEVLYDCVATALREPHFQGSFIYTNKGKQSTLKRKEDDGIQNLLALLG